ncbi:PA2779 family protein [Ketobacter alkanivorans]|nr:PA2779 family protein [Ketobacter alkanivorans]
MSRFTALQRTTARLLAVTMMITGLLSATAQAAMVSTHELVNSEAQQMTRTQVLSILDKEEARSTLLNLGVNPAEVEARIDNMSAEELQAFSEQVNTMQAGGGVVGVVVLVFVILIVLDLLGTTNIFPAIKPINTGG